MFVSYSKAVLSIVEKKHTYSTLSYLRIFSFEVT